jgi:hypothetical protein
MDNFECCNCLQLVAEIISLDRNKQSAKVAVALAAVPPRLNPPVSPLKENHFGSQNDEESIAFSCGSVGVLCAVSHWPKHDDEL